MKLFLKYSIAAVITLISAIAGAADEGIYGSSGLKMIFSDDENISQHYNKPFAIVGWQIETIDLSASYYRWISYTVTDEILNSREIDINQACADITIFAGDILSISGGYSYLAGTSSYIAHKAEGDIILDLENINISLDSSIKNTEYNFDGLIKNTSITTGAEISFDITENYSCDLGYTYEYTDFKTYGYIYKKNSGRIGILAIPANNFFLISGISAGRDSDNINSACFDAGMTVKLFKHLKLSASYMLTAEFISSESVTTTRGRGNTAAASSSGSTYTDFSHTGNISVSLYF